MSDKLKAVSFTLRSLGGTNGMVMYYKTLQGGETKYCSAEIGSGAIKCQSSKITHLEIFEFLKENVRPKLQGPMANSTDTFGGAEGAVNGSAQAAEGSEFLQSRESVEDVEFVQTGMRRTRLFGDGDDDQEEDSLVIGGRSSSSGGSAVTAPRGKSQ